MAEHGKATAETEHMSRMVNASTFGTRGASELRRRTPRESAAALVERVDAVAPAIPAARHTAPESTAPQTFPRWPVFRLTKEELDPLVADAATGDPAAVARLISMITPVAVRYCRARLGGRDLSYLAADDVAQEVCLAVLHALPNYQDRGGSFLYLVHAIASNKVADAYRLVARGRAEPVAELPDRAPGSDHHEPERHFLDGDLGNRLSELLARLPPLHQEILTLRLLVGLSANETAEALNISADNVRVTQHRALSKLRNMITRDGGIIDHRHARRRNAT